MPTIPRYDEQQVQTRALPGARQQIATPIEAFGGQYAEDLGKVAGAVGTLGDAAVDQYEKARDAADKTAVLNALNAADREAMKHDNELSGKVGDYTGPDAKIKVPFESVYHSTISAAYDGPRAGLSPRQLRMYNEKADERSRAAAIRGQEISNKAMDNYSLGVAENTLTEIENRIGTFGAADFSKKTVFDADGKGKTNFDLQIGEIDAAVDVFAHVKGLTEPEKVKLRDGYIGALLAKGATKMLDDSDMIGVGAIMANEHYSKIPQDTRTKLEKLVDGKSIELEGISFAKLAIKEKKSLSQTLDDVDSKFTNPSEAEAIKKQVREQFGIHEQVKTFDYNAAREELFAYQNKTNNPGAFPVSITSRMDPEVVASLKDAWSKALKGVKVEPDLKVFGSLLNLVIARDPRLTDDVFWKHADKLSSEQIEFLIKKRAEIMKPDADGADEVTSAQQLTAQTKLLGLSNKAEGEFMQAYYRELEAAAASSGKRSTVKERQEILTRLALKTRNGKMAYTINPDDYGTTDWAISDADLEAMKQMAPNLDWSDRNVRNRQYVKFKLQGKIQ